MRHNLFNASHPVKNANWYSQRKQSMFSLIILHVSAQFLCVIYHILLVLLYCRAPPHSAVADGVGLREKDFLLRIHSHSWVVGWQKACCLKSPRRSTGRSKRTKSRSSQGTAHKGPVILVHRKCIPSPPPPPRPPSSCCLPALVLHFETPFML